MRTNKDGIINARVPIELRQRLDEISARYGVTLSRMTEDSLLAVADWVEQHGRYERPFRLEVGLAALPGMVAEEPAPYGVPAPPHVQNPKQPGRGAAAKRA